MPKITRVRPVLLSAPYSNPETSAEVRLHLQGGYRTIGLVEMTLDSGIVGLGEGYLAVFAPHVFRTIVELVAPVLVGRDPGDFDRLLREISLTTGYWSWQGAAQHVVSALEIALQDCRAQLAGQSVATFLGGKAGGQLRLYASGGDSLTREAMAGEISQVRQLGIDVFKIRARNHEVAKTLWCQQAAAAAGIRIAVDMTQNLTIPSQSISDIIAFVEAIARPSGAMPAFLEEALGPDEIANYPLLRSRLAQCPIAGGEIVTTARELFQRLEQGYYDIVQPDASVMGGISATLAVFAAARDRGTEVYVHCWGGPVGMMANYHAAVAGSGYVAEWPLPRFPLRDALSIEPWRIANGVLRLSEKPGLGLRLTPEVERAFPFREDAVYRCLTDPSQLPTQNWNSHD